MERFGRTALNHMYQAGRTTFPVTSKTQVLATTPCLVTCMSQSVQPTSITHALHNLCKQTRLFHSQIWWLVVGWRVNEPRMNQELLFADLSVGVAFSSGGWAMQPGVKLRRCVLWYLCVGRKGTSALGDALTVHTDASE